MEGSPIPPRQPPSMPPPFLPETGQQKPPPLPRIPGRPTSLWQETLDEHQETHGDGEMPIGGWLVLIGIGRVIAIPMLLYAFAKVWRVYSSPGVWTRLTSPDSRSYHPLWATTMIYEIGGNAVMLAASITLAWLFFTRRNAFPLAYVMYTIVVVSFLWGDHFLAAIVLRKNNLAPSAEQVGQLLGQSIGTLIWVPYFLLSERVRETFVR